MGGSSHYQFIRSSLKTKAIPNIVVSLIPSLSKMSPQKHIVTTKESSLTCYGRVDLILAELSVEDDSQRGKVREGGKGGGKKLIKTSSEGILLET